MKPTTFEEWELQRDCDLLKLYAKLFAVTTIIVITLLVCCCANADEYAVKTIAYEASNQSLLGQNMVASVIKQRMKDRKLTARQVVLQRHQFSCWDSKGRPTQKRKLTNKELSRAKKAWYTSKPQGYNHYHTKNIIPYWAKDKTGVTIGNHIFYKL